MEGKQRLKWSEMSRVRAGLAIFRSIRHKDGFAVANMTKELRRSCSTLLRQAPTVATDVPLRTPKAFASRQASATTLLLCPMQLQISAYTASITEAYNTSHSRSDFGHGWSE